MVEKWQINKINNADGKLRAFTMYDDYFGIHVNPGYPDCIEIQTKEGDSFSSCYLPPEQFAELIELMMEAYKDYLEFWEKFRAER